MKNEGMEIGNSEMDPSDALVLVLSAHTKDADLGCGGLLRRWSEAGTRVVLVVLTDCSKLSSRLEDEADDLIQERRREQNAAAHLLGYSEVRYLRHPDGELESSEITRREIAAIIRAVRPEVVVSHDPWKTYDLMSDHREAGLLACDAVIAARDPLFFPELSSAGLPPWRASNLVFFEPEDPNEKIDITDFLELKLEAVLKHQSHFIKGRHLRDLTTSELDELRDSLRQEHFDASSGRYLEHIRRVAL